jgi:SNF2 family DNA or RNA helicase
MKNIKFKTLTEVQRIYFAHLLTLRRPKWEVDSSSDALIEAKVDPIPHQVEAAQFVFRNPFQGGVILGDEVGLGKTIETGLVLSQLWAEGKRKILILAPKSLRHQWQDELRDLFYLDSEIIDTKSYSMVEKGIYPDPITATQGIYIT